MFNKLDTHLAKVLMKEQKIEKNIECLVYTKNFDFATSSTQNFLEQNGIKIVAKFPFINAISVQATPKNLKKILNFKQIDFVSTQSQVFALMDVAKKILGCQNFGFGKKITICYIDTGISPHLDFTLGQNRIIKFVDLINFRVFPYDDNGHGTFVSGVGSGNGAMSNGKFSGVCPKSNIVAIKALDQSGEANANKILEAMQWVFDNHKTYGIKVVCMSFGSESLGENDPIMKGAEKLWEEGIVVVAAAGNSGPEYETIKSPGTSAKIITVGGFDDNRFDGQYNTSFFEIAEFSSRGPSFQGFKPDVVAPAVDITSCGIKQPYTTLSGTSVATPMIAGMSAILLENNPNLSPKQIKKQLLSFARPITFNKNKEGNGFVTFN